MKVFNENENKKNIKARLHLSDGRAVAISMMTDKIWK